MHTYYGASPHTGLPPVTDWPLFDAADPIAFGVRPTRKFADEATLPPYVARDGDALLERRMSAAAEAGGLVLVTGEPLSPRRRGREPGGVGLQGETAGAHQGSAR
ncbi:hypothetical protein IPZ64_32720, partial [Streptomyces violaceoruber]|nr:hypothetical protein [Streptomyces violaceoruber]